MTLVFSLFWWRVLILFTLSVTWSRLLVLKDPYGNRKELSLLTRKCKEHDSGFYCLVVVPPPSRGRATSFSWLYRLFLVVVPPPSRGCTASFSWLYRLLFVVVPPPSCGCTASLSWLYRLLLVVVLRLAQEKCQTERRRRSNETGRTCIGKNTGSGSGLLEVTDRRDVWLLYPVLVRVPFYPRWNFGLYTKYRLWTPDLVGLGSSSWTSVLLLLIIYIKKRGRLFEYLVSTRNRLVVSCH